MTPQPAPEWPVSGAPRTAEFTVRGGRGFGRMVTAFAAPLAVGFVVFMLLGAIAFNLVGGVAMAIIGTGVLVGVLYAKSRKLTRSTVVRFSPVGVELTDGHGFRVRLPWSGITRIGETVTRMSNPEQVAGRPGDLRVRAAAVRSMGLVGWGERVVPATAPDWVHRQVAGVPVDPDSGRPEVTIPLGELDPEWVAGEMGEWVRAHRPDLFHAG